MLIVVRFFFFFFSSRRRHTRCREVSWARRCVQETEVNFSVQALPLSLATTYGISVDSVSYTHLRAHETSLHLVCRLLLEKKKKKNLTTINICNPSQIVHVRPPATYSTNLITSHLSLIHISEPTRPLYISYAVFCLKKKKKKT
eukprot:TRINITY_DN8792_c0_g1_i16.p1 TRINITY_DN8792_c0_g1~~TRINITY_DN8792_c0_g1_i16.p1  ORF type:complete len:144 (-),score=56.60 TRINITY_DN8792_c0_g1_i16:84-515(-)